MRRGIALAAAALLAAQGCAVVHQRAEEGAPVTRPGGDEGMVFYSVGRLSFEAPAAWAARGDARRVLLTHPENTARIDAQSVDRPFKSEAECLAQAEDSLARGSPGLTNVRRHATALAGRKAVTQEADQGAWHGWAWAMCDGREQYRLFFTGLSPVRDENLRALHLMTASAVLATAPGAGLSQAGSGALSRRETAAGRLVGEP
jgi:hypothetical protein